MLYVARLALGSGEGHSLLSVQHEEGVRCADCTINVDVPEFEQAAAEARASDDPAQMRRALDLYRGDLLTDHAYVDRISDDGQP